MKKPRHVSVKENRLKTLALVLEGKTIDQIAIALFITPKAVKLRLTSLYKYYGVKSRIQLMAMYIKVPSQFYEKKIKFDKIKTYRKNKNWEKFCSDKNCQLPIGIENDNQ